MRSMRDKRNARHDNTGYKTLVQNSRQRNRKGSTPSGCLLLFYLKNNFFSVQMKGRKDGKTVPAATTNEATESELFHDSLANESFLQVTRICI